MGYYTRYELEVTTPLLNDYMHHQCYGAVKGDLLKAFEEIDILDSVFDENFESCDTVKWYEHEEDMKRISKQFNSLLFILSGEGEENLDSWRKYFLNGRMQVCRAKVAYDSYDEKKLV